MDVILLFPGQGSQKPGMGKDLADAFPEARRVFEEVDEALAFKLSTLCFEGPADDLTATLNAQPALLAHGAAVWAVMKNALGHLVRAGAGHSLGEHTAYHAAGSTSLADAARLVRIRGQLMYETGVTRPGAMAAVLNTRAPAGLEWYVERTPGVDHSGNADVSGWSALIKWGACAKR